MGLDMYFKAKLHTSKYTEKELNVKLKSMFKEIPLSKNLQTIEVVFEIGYLRKANAIHDWIVKNIQNDKDECQESYLHPEKLDRLRRLCVQVLKDNKKAPELLPTADGFFFGSEEYDEYYFNDLRETINIIDRALNLDGDRYEIYYQSSW